MDGGYVRRAADAAGFLCANVNTPIERVRDAVNQPFSRRTFRRLAATCCLALAATLVGDWAFAADGPAAVVMEISGTTRPPLAVHREIAPGTRIGLAPGAQIALLHYATCSIVTVAGGDVTVTEQGLQTAAPATQSAKPGPCPRVHRISLAGPGPLGGVVVSRNLGTPTPPVVAAAGALVLVTGTGAVKAAELLDVNGQVVAAALPIRDNALKLPETLALRKPYVIRFRIDGKSDAVDVPISTSGPAAGGVLVLRLE